MEQLAEAGEQAYRALVYEAAQLLRLLAEGDADQRLALPDRLAPGEARRGRI